jgi:hypothetical protein
MAPVENSVPAVAHESPVVSRSDTFAADLRRAVDHLAADAARVAASPEIAQHSNIGIVIISISYVEALLNETIEREFRTASRSNGLRKVLEEAIQNEKNLKLKRKWNILHDHGLARVRWNNGTAPFEQFVEIQELRSALIHCGSRLTDTARIRPGLQSLAYRLLIEPDRHRCEGENWVYSFVRAPALAGHVRSVLDAIKLRLAK